MPNKSQEPRRWTLRQGYSGVGVIGGPSLAAELSVIVVESSTYDALLAERDEWRGKAERQYDENVDLIARNGALLAERDALKAALLAESAHYQECSSELAALKIEMDEADALNTRLSRILTDTAHVLKGTPEALHSHSWADLAQVAAALKDKAERLHGHLRNLSRASEFTDCLACTSGDFAKPHSPDCPAHPDFLTTSATERKGVQ